MTAIVTLFLIGSCFLALEVFVPGAVMGIIGALAYIAGIVMAFVSFGVTGGVLAFGAALLLVALTLYLEFAVIPRTRLAKSLTMSTTVTATSQPELAKPDDVLGKTGETATPLAPSGYIVLDGRRYEAFSRSGFLPAGTPIKVSSIDNFRIIVTRNQI